MTINRKFSSGTALSIILLFVFLGCSGFVYGEKDKLTTLINNTYNLTDKDHGSLILLEKKCKDFDAKILLIKKVADTPSMVEARAHSLHTALKKVISWLDIIVVIPNMSFQRKVRDLSKKCAEMNDKVQKVRDTAKKIDAAIKPARKVIDNLDKQLKNLVKAIDKVVPKLKDHKSRASDSQDCVNALPEGSVKQGLQKDLNKWFDEANAVLKPADKNVRTILSKIEDLEDFIKNHAVPNIDVFDKFQTDMDHLNYDILRKLLKPLEDVAWVLRQDFEVKFPYLNPTLKNPMNISDYKLHISMMVIIKGTKEIEDTIEKYLSWALMKAAREFGIDKLIKSLEDEAWYLMNATLKRLHLPTDISLPGLDSIEEKFELLEKSLLAFSEQDTDVSDQPLTDLIDKIRDWLNDFEFILEQCRKVVKH